MKTRSDEIPAGRPGLLIASGLAEHGGIFALGHGTAARRLTGQATTGLASWAGGSRLAAAAWAQVDPPPPDSAVEIHALGRAPRRIRAALREPHSLIRFRGNLVGVSTYENRIAEVDGGRALLEAPGTGDSWHINSLSVADNRLVASAFGRFSRHREWAEPNKRNGAGVVFDVATGEDLARGLSCPHDPRFTGREWLVCNSAERALLRMDQDWEPAGRAELGGWTRGLAWDESSIYVGVSAHRMLCDSGKARVVRLDRETLEPMEDWILPCEEVFSLVWIDPRLADQVAAGERGRSALLAA